MNNRNIAFLIYCCISLFLALQVWVWFRYIGALWLSESLNKDMMESLFKSVSPLKVSLEGFLLLVVPVLATSFYAKKRLSVKKFVVASLLFGMFFSFTYLLYLAPLNFDFISKFLWIYLAIGSASGLVYGTILVFPYGKAFSSTSAIGSSATRRKLVGSVGLLTGVAGLFGSISGPLYFWRNEKNFIDVDVGLLEEGQLMAAKLANKPVWIIRRSPEVIRLLEQENPKLRDPNSKYSKQPKSAENNLRSIRPEYFVVVGICTHLGCTPRYELNSGSFVSPDPQFFCPCHGGAFDLSGRVFSGTPPPENLVIPNHEYLSENVVRLYFPTLNEAWSS
jgi:ubiquinol-cytochrome c reductase iron-sulfur subunit